MGTEDFFREPLDGGVDLRHPLVPLARCMPWAQIEAALAPAPAQRDRKGRMVEGTSSEGATRASIFWSCGRARRKKGSPAAMFRPTHAPGSSIRTMPSCGPRTVSLECVSANHMMLRQATTCKGPAFAPQHELPAQAWNLPLRPDPEDHRDLPSCAVSGDHDNAQINWHIGRWLAFERPAERVEGQPGRERRSIHEG